MSIGQRMRIWWLRRRLRAIWNDIEVIERGRIVAGQDLDRLMRLASNLRADIWYAENPRPPAGTTLRGLNAPITRRSELRRVSTGRTA